MSIHIASCQAPNAAPSVLAIVQYLDQQLETSSVLVQDLPWQERMRAFENGDIKIVWICGSHYVDLMNKQPSDFLLLTAPVMAVERYQNRPVYFSDIIVRADSPFQDFSDLRNKSWAYNEPGSYSGALITRYYLACSGLDYDYFCCTIESGAHQTSLQMVLDGEIDATIIDSTVLETELRRHPELSAQIRVVESLGPSPIPPWVLHTSLSPHLQVQIREAMLHMHENEAGRKALDVGHIARFASVEDSDYDIIRSRIQIAKRTVPPPPPSN